MAVVMSKALDEWGWDAVDLLGIDHREVSPFGVSAPGRAPPRPMPVDEVARLKLSPFDVRPFDGDADKPGRSGQLLFWSLDESMTKKNPRHQSSMSHYCL